MSPELDQWPEIRIESTFAPIKTRREIESAISERYGCRAIVFSSGRAALRTLALAMDICRDHEILIPEWSSHCLYNSLGEMGTPTIRSPNPHMILLNHKWGIPHQLGDRLADHPRVVEDSVDSIIVDRLGLFRENGVCEIVSLSKIMAMPGGAIAFFANCSLADRVARVIEDNDDRSLCQDHWERKKAFFSRPPGAKKGWEYDALEPFITGVHPELLGWVADFVQEIDLLIERTHIRFDRAMKVIGHKIPLLGKIKMPSSRLPTVIPIPRSMLSQEADQQFANVFQIRYFDLNRNASNPDFQPCFAFPLHIGVSSGDFERTMALLAGANSQVLN
jgi:hypothetical protein